MYRLADYYKGIPEFDELEDKLLDIEKENFDNIEKLKRELIIITSNEEGLDIWSKTLGTSKTKLDILTKLRGSKTITKLNLAYIIKDILNQDTLVEVTEQNEIYRVLIGVHDTNENLDGIQEKLREELKLIIPSHIELLIYFNSLIWVKYEAYNKNWDAWDGLNLSWNRFERYNESV
ncbi:hypothetical protein [Streptobacillus canis]|uniref:hypothetical protein n=1 Tax=Streptobacillus canis TaxID=2678686 RepID=UPI0012E2FABC|nr:hypothetical protein [Streptobacillus canis]